MQETVYLSSESAKRLSTVYPDLAKVIMEATKLFPLMVVCGYRDENAQNEAFASGASKQRWPNSKHNTKPSLAVDISPIPYETTNVKKLTYIAGHIMAIAHQMGIKLRWGGDFNMNLNPADDNFQDLYHFEILL